MLWKSLTSNEPSLAARRPPRPLAHREAGGRRRRSPPTSPPGRKALWRFTSVGHIGKVGGPKAWMEPVNPLIAQQEVRFKMPGVARRQGGHALARRGRRGRWQRARLRRLATAAARRAGPARPAAARRPRRHARTGRSPRAHFRQRRRSIWPRPTKPPRHRARPTSTSWPASTASKPTRCAAWLDYLGIGAGGAVEVDGHFTNKITSVGGYDFVNGWGSNETPLLVANSSDQHVRIPGNMKPHSVAVHPSPTLRAAVGWRSPVAATMRVEGPVTHAHPECGNGVTWSLELRRGATRQRLATGIAQGDKEVKVGPFENVAVQTGRSGLAARSARATAIIPAT